MKALVAFFSAEGNTAKVAKVRHGISARRNTQSSPTSAAQKTGR